MNKEQIKESILLRVFDPKVPKDDITVMTNLQGFEGLGVDEQIKQIYTYWKQGEEIKL